MKIGRAASPAAHLLPPIIENHRFRLAAAAIDADYEFCHAKFSVKTGCSQSSVLLADSRGEASNDLLGGQQEDYD
jgi:hypothetical protein